MFHPSIERVFEEPVHQQEEVAELVGMCLWDVFSDNHEVLAADGRLIDLGSWRGSSAFLDEYVHDYRDSFREADDMRFYMGSAWIDGRADLALVYTLSLQEFEVARRRLGVHLS